MMQRMLENRIHNEVIINKINVYTFKGVIYEINV